MLYIHILWYYNTGSKCYTVNLSVQHRRPCVKLLDRMSCFLKTMFCQQWTGTSRKHKARILLIPWFVSGRLGVHLCRRLQTTQYTSLGMMNTSTLSPLNVWAVQMSCNVFSFCYHSLNIILVQTVVFWFMLVSFVLNWLKS